MDQRDSRNHFDPHPSVTAPDAVSPTTPAAVPAWRGLALAYTIAVACGLVLTTLIVHTVAWAWMQVGLAWDTGYSALLWPAATAVPAVVVALGCLPLVFMRALPRLRRVGLTWIAAAALAALLGVTRLVPIGAGGVELALQAAVCLCVALVVGVAVRRRPREGEPPPASGAFWSALCIGGLVLAPWTWAGALGSLEETLLAVCTALAFGAVVAMLLGDGFWGHFADVSAAKRIMGGGSAAATALLLAGSGLGGPGLQLPIMVTLAAMGFAIAALQRRTPNSGRVSAAAAAPAVFGPLAFVDADEFLPLVFGPDFGKWVAAAALLSIVVAWLAGAVTAGLASRLVPYPAAAAGVAVLVASFVVGVNSVSQPGFHGDKLLVVMTEQADLSGVAGDRDERVAQVHQLLRDVADSSQESLRAELDDRGVEYTPYYLVNAVEVDATLASRPWLESRDDVSHVLLNPVNRPVPAPETPRAGEALDDVQPQPNIDQVGAPAAWEAGADGEGVVIGISDSGVDGDHPAFADRFRGGDDSWADPVAGSAAPTDPDGHGTHALGLALGGDGIGVAPRAEWTGCANLPRNAGNPGDYLACLQFMLAPYADGDDPFADGDPARAPHIVTNSWGCPGIEGCDETVLSGAVEAFDAAGVLFVAAVGNSGPECGSASTPPGNYPDALSVGAVNASDELAEFSSRGPAPAGESTVAKPEMVAPGVDVVSALPDGGYGELSGTSMAAPHVAGAAAALWSAEPSLIGDLDTTVSLLSDTASQVQAADSAADSTCAADTENGSGAGVIDVAAAVEAATSSS